VDRWGIRLALVYAGAVKTALGADAVAGDIASSPYAPLLAARRQALAAGRTDGASPAAVAAEILSMVEAREERLRWPCDATSRRVLPLLLGQADAERDAFLRDIDGSAWWSAGREGPAGDGHDPA
jgi:hypothetical protein